MRTIALFGILILAVVSCEARSYYGKRPVKPIIKPQICPDVPCPRIFIEPQCRRPTYYIHNGVQCTGCPENICKHWQGGARQWDDDWEFGRNSWPVRNNWRRRQNWQNDQIW